LLQAREPNAKSLASENTPYPDYRPRHKVVGGNPKDEACQAAAGFTSGFSVSVEYLCVQEIDGIFSVLRFRKQFNDRFAVAIIDCSIVLLFHLCQPFSMVFTAHLKVKVLFFEMIKPVLHYKY
jgi:hypothetical protein